RYHSLLLQPLDPFGHRRGGHLHVPRQLRHGQAGVRPEVLQELVVHPVERAICGSEAIFLNSPLFSRHVIDVTRAQPWMIGAFPCILEEWTSPGYEPPLRPPPFVYLRTPSSW